MQNKTYYDVLGIGKYATPTEVKDAYIEKSVLTHPLR